MRHFHHLVMPVQITGPTSAIDNLIQQDLIRGARRLERHSQVWVEASDISADEEIQVRLLGCKVHMGDPNNRTCLARTRAFPRLNPGTQTARATALTPDA